jgi:DNA-directed RNA polymerase subunit RPC12/RpoP
VAHEYRFIAKERLSKAVALLATNEDDNLIYACLELRKCVEALAYDQLTYYLSEVPLKAFSIWQPDRVVRELLRIDPKADKSRRISMQREATETEPVGPWIELGEDRRLNAQRIGKMYHQLGSFIHVPTIKQVVKSPSPDFDTIRSVVEEIKSKLDHVLSAKIWNANFGANITYNCTECETPIKRRVEVLQEDKQVQCGGCGQFYNVNHDAEKVDWYFSPVTFYWYCEGCGAEREIAQSKAKPGLDVSCPKCKTSAVLTSVQHWGVKQSKRGATSFGTDSSNSTQ